jgi:hypothetical protein
MDDAADTVKSILYIQCGYSMNLHSLIPTKYQNMSCTTPTRRLESSAKHLLRRVHMCTERSFEQTPVRHTSSKRKTVQALSSTFSSGITLLSIGDHTLVGDNTLIDNSFLSLDRTLTENNHKKVCTKV